MARGSSDYGLPDYSFFAVETPVSDVVSERQGFSRLDNRGRVLWFDDFRNGVTRWDLDSDPVGNNPLHKISSGKSVGFHGSLLLDPTEEGGYSSLYKTFMLPVSKRMGLEVAVYLPNNFGQFNFRLEHNFDGTLPYNGIVKVRFNTGEVYLQSSAGEQTIVTPSSSAYLRQKWMSIKFTADYETGQYIRCMIGNQQYDLENFSMTQSGAGFIGMTHIDVWCSGGSGVHVEPIYIGYVVISGDEP
jgi:hypothetical protein